MGGLISQANKLGLDTEQGRNYLIEYHKRLVLPVGCLMLSFLALPLGLQARPGKKAIGVPVALSIFIIYYILHTLGKDLAEGGTVPTGVAMWFPNVLFFTLAIFWIYQVTNEKPLIPEKMTYFCHKIWQIVWVPCLGLLQKISSTVKRDTPKK